MCDVGGATTLAPQDSLDPLAPRDPLDDLVTAVARFCSRPRDDGRSPARVGEDLVRLRQSCNRLEVEFSLDAARFAATEEYDADGAISPLAWIRHQCHMTGHAAASAIAVGEQTATLERSAASMTEGRIGFAHLTLLARTAEALRGSPVGFDEARLLRQAEAHSPNRFRRDCAHARHAGDAAAFLAEQVDAVEARSLLLTPAGENGAFWLRGFLDPVGGAALRSALEPLARHSGDGDHRERPRRWADALVELASHALDTGVGLEGRRQQPHLLVTAGVETLMGLTGAPAGELDGATPIAAATVQRLACGSSVSRILLGPDSAVIDVGRARRVPPAATRRALVHRDGGCVWPGCERPASWTEVHHRQHWSKGGPTNLANLDLRCHRHHWLTHEGGWQLVTTAKGVVVAIPPIPGETPPIRGPNSDRAA